MQIDEPPTRPGFITALEDAYLMPREDGFAVFSRSSGYDLCTVRPEVAKGESIGHRGNLLDAKTLLHADEFHAFDPNQGNYIFGGSTSASGPASGPTYATK